MISAADGKLTVVGDALPPVETEDHVHREVSIRLRSGGNVRMEWDVQCEDLTEEDVAFADAIMQILKDYKAGAFRPEGPISESEPAGFFGELITRRA